MFARLSPPLSVSMKVDKEVKKVLSRYRTEKVFLSKSRRNTLERRLREWVSGWQDSTSGMHEKLRERLDFMEGKEEPTDFPFGSGNSSHLDVRYAVSQSRTMRANFIKSVFTDPQIVVAKVKPGGVRTDEINKAEAAVNWTMSEDSNGLDVLKDTPTPIFRDGTALIHGEWVRKVERGVEQKSYQTVSDFQADYPDAESAGVSVEKYDEILRELDRHGEELHVEYEMDFVSKNEIEYTNFPLAKFIFYPLWVKDIRDAVLYGYSYRIDGCDYNTLVQQGYFDDKLESDKPSSGGWTDADTWDSAQDRIEGLNTEDLTTVSHNIAKLVVRIDLDKDKIPESYRVNWDLDERRILRVERYNLWRNVPSVVPFRWIRRSGRMLGDSILADGMDMYRLINAIHRHRSNVRRLTDSVTLMLPLSLKDHADLGAEYAQFKPGMTLWIPDQFMQEGRIPRQLEIHNLSRSSDSADEEQFAMRYLDMVAGVSQGQSGRETSADPTAPAAKTAMLLARADLRGEDLVLEWSRSIPHFTDLHRALIKANAGGILKFRLEKKDDDIGLDVLTQKNLSFVLKPMKLSMHPEMEMNRIAVLAAAAMKMGIFQIDPGILPQFWNDFVIASRVENPEKYMAKVTPEGVSVGGKQMGMAQFGQMIQGGMGNVNSPGTPADSVLAGISG